MADWINVTSEEQDRTQYKTPWVVTYIKPEAGKKLGRFSISNGFMQLPVMLYASRLADLLGKANREEQKSLFGKNGI